MNLDHLVASEIDRYDWSAFREAHGPATGVPDTIRQLLSAGTPEEAGAAYWKLENRVFIQSGIFSSALPTTSVIMAALVEARRPKYVVSQLLEVLFHILKGVPIRGEPPGEQDLSEQCKSAARSGLWILYRIYQEGIHWQVAGEIIGIIDDTGRLQSLQERNARNGRVDRKSIGVIPPDALLP